MKNSRTKTDVAFNFIGRLCNEFHKNLPLTYADWGDELTISILIDVAKKSPNYFNNPSNIILIDVLENHYKNNSDAINNIHKLYGISVLLKLNNIFNLYNDKTISIKCNGDVDYLYSGFKHYLPLTTSYLNVNIDVNGNYIGGIKLTKKLINNIIKLVDVMINNTTDDFIKSELTIFNNNLSKLVLKWTL